MAINDYATLAQVQAEFFTANGLTSSSDYDTLIEGMITQASRLIDRETKRRPGAYAVTSTDEETRYYTGSGASRQWVDEMAAAPSAVAVSETGSAQSSDYRAYASTDYFLYPYNAGTYYEPYTRIDLDVVNGAYSTFYRYPKGVRVTAPFGYATTDKTPVSITKAVIITVIRWLKRAQQAYRDIGAMPEMGQLTYTQALDPDVLEVLQMYRRVTI